MRFGTSLVGSRPLREWVARIVKAEQCGFDFAWVADAQMVTPDVYSTLALAANATTTIRLGAGVTNTVTRDVTVTAGAMLALAEFSNDRCVLGVGLGGRATGSIGVPQERIDTFRRKLLMIRELLAGRSVRVGETNVTAAVPPRPVPIYVATASPRGLALAGEIADGVIMNVGVAPDVVREAVSHVRTSAERAGRQIGDIDIAVIAGASVGADRARAANDCRGWAATTVRRLAAWTSAARFRTAGEEVAKIYRWDGHLSGGTEYAKAVPDDLVRELTLAGTVEECVDAITALRACGVTQVVPAFLGEDFARAVESFARDVMPRRGS